MLAAPGYLCCLLLALFLAQPCDSAACTSGNLVDTTTLSGVQPTVSTTRLPLKIKVIDSLTISFINVYLIDNDQSDAPSVASLYDDDNGQPSRTPLYTSTNSRVVSANEYQIDMGNTNLNPGVYWLVFTPVQPGGLMAGWTWSTWSGEDYFHSLSFADSYSSLGVGLWHQPRCGLTSAIPSSVLFPLSSAVRFAVCFTVRFDVRSAVRFDVGFTVRFDVRSAVRFDVRPAVRFAVGITVRFAIRSAVRFAFRSALSCLLTFASGFPNTAGDVNGDTIDFSFVGPIVFAFADRLVALTNATAEFEPNQAAFRLSGTFEGNDPSQHLASSVESRLSSLHLGNTTLLAADLAANMTREIVHDRGGEPIAYIYSVSLDSLRLHQSFAFHKRATNATFAGVDFAIPANSVKWSLNFTSHSSSLSSRNQPTTVRYRLNGAGLTAAPDARIASRADTPVAGLTTYFLPLNSDSAQSVVSMVVLFDVAVVDGVVTTVRHHITATTAGDYEVVVELPPFEEWVHYDPSVGMGALLGSVGGGGSDNTGVIIGVAVAVPVAVAVVVAAIAAGVAFAWFKRRSLWAANAVNFTDAVHEQLADSSDAL